MNREQLRRVVPAAMVALGLLQAAWGVYRGDAPFAVLGATYAALGAGSLWFHAAER